MNPYSTVDKSVVLSPAHRELAVQAASMSFVLLKNIKRYLPIRKRFLHLAVRNSLSVYNEVSIVYVSVKYSASDGRITSVM